jgi:hypothetical protein
MMTLTAGDESDDWLPANEGKLEEGSVGVDMLIRFSGRPFAPIILPARDRNEARRAPLP